ncbi:MAG: 50S ribosomal protein L7/L12 [Candidatus Moranbacteria bacterium GW2011_GWC1_45_18]|nr:MAG: 50S ribosomal protein L7/L12 [Candidatus Moranbacteria bacterium GW2011_GWC2_40_12]KKT34003.1 MAG: 50S ribosomal protein L7/L12 [Candidatus Moranbacteria bacterium GW2011_GWF2_44_10]KKT99331.1 MAG: 50S ribosomal protein L7/L12 [Candidatus Moranbacteria bacterium GW2011_GWC1_45_18]OGI40689.1 MAG: hypothetical protein A2374_00395 [Candidatus Moranbacteria bacterium RIFOXYB1_FULL_44_23]OGI41443.1 MAG: hypothetical protein A2593_01375 [Candidatus Moranbacteria bacterium RIFOXYD1_FULL_44_9]
MRAADGGFFFASSSQNFRMPKKKKSEKDNGQELQKIAAIREMIANAERTIVSARAMLSQLEGKPMKRSAPIISSDEEGEIVEGVFDGQVMMGTDGKQYPVPANYASKSKLVEGDMLKLTITPDGSFVYKQIGPVERKRLIGIVSQDDLGNYVVLAEGKAYRVLLASVTYFKAEPADEVTVVVPRDSDSVWGAIENLVRKGVGGTDFSAEDFGKEENPEEEKEDKIIKSTKDKLGQDGKLEGDFIDEWTPELEKLREEASRPVV